MSARCQPIRDMRSGKKINTRLEKPSQKMSALSPYYTFFVTGLSVTSRSLLTSRPYDESRFLPARNSPHGDPKVRNAPCDRQRPQPTRTGTEEPKWRSPHVTRIRAATEVSQIQ